MDLHILNSFYSTYIVIALAYIGNIWNEKRLLDIKYAHINMYNIVNITVNS